MEVVEECLEIIFSHTVLLTDGGQVDQDAAIQQIATRCYLFDAVEDDRATKLEDGLFAISIHLSIGITRSSRNAAKRVREPGWEHREIVEGQDMVVLCGNREGTVIVRDTTERRLSRIKQVVQNLGR